MSERPKEVVNYLTAHEQRRAFGIRSRPVEGLVDLSIGLGQCLIELSQPRLEAGVNCRQGDRYRLSGQRNQKRLQHVCGERVICPESSRHTHTRPTDSERRDSQSCEPAEDELRTTSFSFQLAVEGVESGGHGIEEGLGGRILRRKPFEQFVGGRERAEPLTPLTDLDRGFDRLRVYLIVAVRDSL